jgi:hypothetical protein
MFTATFFFLGLSVCILAGLVCFAMARALKTANAAAAIQPSADEKAAWERLKKALVELHSRYEGLETAKEKTLRSWAGTLVICSGLCMIGILLETRYDQLISVKSVVSGLVGHQKLAPTVIDNATLPASRLDVNEKPAKGGKTEKAPKTEKTAKPASSKTK